MLLLLLTFVFLHLPWFHCHQDITLYLGGRTQDRALWCWGEDPLTCSRKRGCCGCSSWRNLCSHRSWTRRSVCLWLGLNRCCSEACLRPAVKATWRPPVSLSITRWRTIQKNQIWDKSDKTWRWWCLRRTLEKKKGDRHLHHEGVRLSTTFETKTPFIWLLMNK